VDWLPDTLSPDPNVVWEKRLPHPSLGGIAATSRYVIFGGRDYDDFQDVFRCLDADTGETIWEIERLAIGALDYGNSTRSTPLIVGEHVFCQGALGTLLCLHVEDGEVLWERNLADDFKPSENLPWGYCASPLIAAGNLVVNPGAADGSLVALDPATGDVVWKTPGPLCAYGSFITHSIAGTSQIVGQDAESIGGWDATTGRRLWKVLPNSPGDFNVPTPIAIQNRLLIATEGNGVRLYQFDDAGQLAPEWLFRNTRVRSDMSSPIVIGELAYCAKDFLTCLDLQDELKEKWRLRDRSISDYGAIVASDERMMVIADGELLLLGTDGNKKILSRQKIFSESIPIYSHPAFVGRRMYVRGETKLLCIEL